MNLRRVTITGADDETSILEIHEIQKRFPFVEWGILISTDENRGAPRFPERKWIHHLVLSDTDRTLQLSLHLCGEPVRSVCKGDWSFAWSYGNLEAFDRVQLNFHAYTHLLNEEFANAAKSIQMERGFQLIFQVDGVNDQLVKDAIYQGVGCVPLYDKSGGAGVVPNTWPPAIDGVYSGYAGGLGPSNIADELPKIEVAARGNPFWIDMETHVRTDNGAKLDMDKVVSCLEACEPHVKQQDATAS